MAKLRWKRWLYLLHRWAGIILCLLFAAWFFSGVVMMYVEFPQLHRNERLSGLTPLDFSSARFSPAAAVALLHEGDFSTSGAPSENVSREISDPSAPLTTLTAVHLGMLLDRPIYRVDVKGAQPRVVFADSGEQLRDVTPELAVVMVANFVRRAGIYVKATAPRYVERSQTDQWTVSGGLNAHRPLLKVALDDDAGHEFYVSSTTGEVARDTSRWERSLNWVGAVTHWIYPTVIRRHPDFWAWLVDIVAGAGVILAISGLWIGILRWKFKRRPGKSAVPYRGLMRWHYFTGAFFGVCTLTWVFSGWMSMNPGGFNLPRSPSTAEAAATTGIAQTLRASDFAAPVPHFDNDIVHAELLHYDGRAFYLASRRDGGRELIDATSGAHAHTDIQRLTALAPALMPNAQLRKLETLNEYDNYYYNRHPERGDKALPVLRVEFDDPSDTWFHIDVLSGQVVERSTTTNRVYRWIYNGLHSWDIWWLWQRRPLWDIAVLTFSIGGLSLSILGIVIGWRRLRR